MHKKSLIPLTITMGGLAAQAFRGLSKEVGDRVKVEGIFNVLFAPDSGMLLAQVLGEPVAGLIAGLGANLLSAQLTTSKKADYEHELERASSHAIQRVIEAWSSEASRPRAIHSVLGKLAKAAVKNHAPEALAELGGDAAEVSLLEILGDPRGFLRQNSLSAKQWEMYLHALGARAGLDLSPIGQDLGSIATRLHEGYAEALFRVLSVDAATDGKAFAGSVLKLLSSALGSLDGLGAELAAQRGVSSVAHGATREAIRELRAELEAARLTDSLSLLIATQEEHREILQSLSATLERLPASLGILETSFARLTRKIERGFDELKQLLSRDQLAKNPTALAVWDVLEAVGWISAPGHLAWVGLEDGALDLVVKAPASAVATRVGCLEGMPTAFHLDRLARRLQADGGLEARLVTAADSWGEGLERQARDRGIRLQTYRALVFEALGLDSYRSSLAKAISEKRVSGHWYIEPQFSEVQGSRYEEQASRRIQPGLAKHLNGWLGSRDPVQRALLGEFGSGKSSFLLVYASGLLAGFGRQPATDRLPVLLRAGLSPAFRHTDELLGKLGEETGSRLGEPGVFHALNQAGRLLVIFDGLDEVVMGSGGGPSAVFLRLRELLPAAGKLILAGRTSLFRGLAVQEEILGEPGKIQDGSAFQALLIEPFDRDRIGAYIRARRPREAERIIDLLSDIYDLRDLATRPVMLAMILDHWDQIEERQRAHPGERIEIGDLYKLYTDQWIKGAQRQGKEQVKPEDRLRLMVAIAVWMKANAREEMDLEALDRLIRDSLDLNSVRSYEAVEEELRSQTFLVRGGNDSYYFAHRSFMEFFLARRVVEEITEARPGLLAQEALSKEVIDFTSVHKVEVEQVWVLLEMSRRGANEPILNGNLLSILRDQQVSFRDRKLSGLRARKANLRGANLRAGDFRGCELAELDVRDANLSGADFRGARLPKLILGVRSAAKCVRFVPGTTDVLSGTDDGGVCRISIRDPTGYQILHRHEESVTCVASGGSESLVASGGFDGRVRISQPGAEPGHLAYSHNGIVYGVAVSPDGAYVASSDSKGRLKVWERASREVVGEWSDHEGVLYTVDWSPLGDALVTGSFSDTVVHWRRINRGRFGLVVEQRSSIPGVRVNGVRFSPDGAVLATASHDGVVRIWQAGTGNLLHQLPSQIDQEWAVAFDPAGKLLASAGSDGRVRIWDWRQENLKIDWLAHGSEIWSLDYDSSGRFLASGSLDGYVSVWSVETRQRVAHVGFQHPDQKLKAKGTRLAGVRDLSPLQKRILLRLGAIDESTRS